jgi:trans-2,3-dihydro-3-hydroxyanthranilate isomerase
MNAARAHRYVVVDVFTRNALEGNALAVFPDGAAIDERLMPRIARELNLSETVFVFPATRPDCAAALRIFTPASELIFAGHPTVGTAYVLMQESRVPAGTERFTLEEKVGPVPVRIGTGEQEGERPLIWLRTPPIEYGRCFDRAGCAEALGLAEEDLLAIDPQWVSAGNPTIFIALRDRAAVDRAWLEMDGVRRIKAGYEEPACIFVFAPTEQGAYSRMFAPELGVVEDPATGSSTGPLASYMRRHTLIAPHLITPHPGARFISEQGTKMGRRSILYVQMLEEAGVEVIEVGGYVTPLIEATMTLPGN